MDEQEVTVETLAGSVTVPAPRSARGLGDYPELMLFAGMMMSPEFQAAMAAPEGSRERDFALSVGDRVEQTVLPLLCDIVREGCILFDKTVFDIPFQSIMMKLPAMLARLQGGHQVG